MMMPDVFRFSFLISCFILIGSLVFLTYKMYALKNAYRKYIAIPVIIGIYTIIAYCLFLVSKSHFMAVFFDSLFFIGTDWLAMFMLIFAIEYTEISLNFKKPFMIVCSICCGIDSISLFVNNWTFHMFDLVQMTSRIGITYWGNDFTIFHYFHLMMCYVMVGFTFLYFVISFLMASSLYKEKYLGIFVAYLIVIFVNLVCYSVNLPFDFSVILYGVLAGFICYYSTFSFPHQLLNQTLHTVNESINDAVIYYDIDGICVYANKPAKNIFSTHGNFNLTAAEVFYQKVNSLLETDYDVNLTETIEVEGEPRIFEVEFHKEFNSGYSIGSFLRLVDRTEEINRREQERYEATHDELTGILNRNGFFEAVEEDIKKNGSKNKVMLCSNIKDFKLINELFGEKTGDEVLCKEASLLREYSHETNIFGRLNDDKFALYCDVGFGNEEMLLNYIHSMQKLTESNVYRMHVYVGIYKPQGPVESVQTMCDKALMAMKNATEQGNYKQVFAYYDSDLMEKLLNEKNIAEDFEQAIAKNQIKMYLQPIIDSKRNRFGAEALTRWYHPLRGLMYPGEFLPILEKTGLIYQLDEYIWEQAAQKLSEWNKNGCTDCYISVNVSEKDFFYTDIYKTFSRLVEQYDINPSCLHIEITELVLMSDFSKASTLAKKLQNAGFYVVLDNFGKGYSSLNMLKDFKTDVLKIDMAFIKESVEQSRNYVILESIIKMANSLNLEVVGEGVENRDQYEVLRKLDCPVFQGNYLSEPITVEDYEDKFVRFFYKN